MQKTFYVSIRVPIASHDDTLIDRITCCEEKEIASKVYTNFGKEAKIICHKELDNTTLQVLSGYITYLE